MDNQQPSLGLRRCKKCGEEKPLTEFPIYDRRGWRRHACKVCWNVYFDKWSKGALPPKPKIRAGHRICRECGVEKPLDKFAKVYAERKRGKNYRQHVCQECYKDIHAARQRRARRLNPELYRKIQRKSANKHRSKIIKSRRVKREKIKDDVFAAYGGYCCACCGETHPSMLTIDHVNDDGAEHRKKLGYSRLGGGGNSIYRWLRDHDYPDGFQVLCYNCNISKHRLGACAHKEGSTTIPKGSRAKRPEARSTSLR